MEPSLNQRYAPITSTVGLVRATLAETRDAFVEWQHGVLSKYGQFLQEKEIEGSLGELIELLTPLSKPVPTRYLLLAAGDTWTAFFDNGWRGTDAEGVVAVLSCDLGTIGLRLTAVPNTMPSANRRSDVGRYGSLIFQVFEASQRCRRSIACANDGGRWVFEHFGRPFDFEDTASYLRKKKADRFSMDQLEAYAQAMGVIPFEQMTYARGDSGQARGILLEKGGSLPPSLQEEDFNDVRRKLGLPEAW